MCIYIYTHIYVRIYMYVCIYRCAYWTCAASAWKRVAERVPREGVKRGCLWPPLPAGRALSLTTDQGGDSTGSEGT